MDSTTFTSSEAAPPAGHAGPWAAILAAASLLVVASSAPAQVGVANDTSTAPYSTGQYVATVTGPDRRIPDRAELETRLRELESQLNSGVLDEEGRQELRREIQRLESRLQDGDFRPGDVLRIRVPGYPDASGKVVVGPDHRITLPGFESETVDLSGLLYAEARGVVAKTVQRYIRTDRVDVQPLIRVAVLGSVNRPGFYDAAPTVPLAELLMAAGGPSAQGELQKVEFRRGDENLLNDRESQLTRLTLQDLNARHGDQVVVPAQGSGFGWGTVATILGTTTGLIWGLSRIF